MLEIEIDGTFYHAKTTWEEITLTEFVSVCAMPMPEKLKAIYASLHDNSEEGKIKSSEVLSSIDYDDEIKIFPEYYGRVLKLLSDIPQDIIDLMDAVERKTLFDICHHVICLSSISDTPLFKNEEGKIGIYSPSEDESFSFLGTEYFYPKSLKLAGLSSPMENEPIITFTEASDVLSNWHQAGKGNVNISMIAAIYCRKKDEVYSESIVKERSGTFENLPMSVIWRLFFCIIRSMRRLRTDIPTSLLAIMEQTKQTRLKPPDLTRSGRGVYYLRLRKKGSSEPLNKPN